MWWWWWWCCENAGHLKMKMCSWSAPSSSSSTTIRVSFFFCEQIDIELDLGTFSTYLEIQPDNFGPKEKSDLLVALVHKDSWKNGMADFFYDFDAGNYHHICDESDEGENDEEYLSVWGQESIRSHLSQERHESPLRTLATPFGNKNSNVGIPNISLPIKTTMATIVVTRTLPPPNIRLQPLQDSCPAAGGSIPRFPPGGKISRV